MYTNLINVQIIISLLKQYNIRHLVLSPGTRNAPLVHSVEGDPFFKCYSVVDERSAGYFALGLSRALKRPVCVSCTSSTATCNYLPAIKEAWGKNLPLIALTADRNSHKLYQMEDQMIDQTNMYGKYTHCSVDLPEVHDADATWFCTRKVNEAFDAVSKGPVQVNFQVSLLGSFNVPELPVYRKINLHSEIKNDFGWEQFRGRLLAGKRIMVLCGQHYPQNARLRELLIAFSLKYNCIISADHLTNFYHKDFLKTILVTESMTDQEFEQFMPDIVITLGKHIWSFIKYKLRNKGGEFEHWRVSPDGRMTDGLRSLAHVFKCTPEVFFENMNKVTGAQNDRVYFDRWRRRIDEVKLPDLKFTNFSVIRDLSRCIPHGALVHTTILNATRLTNFQGLDDSVTCYSNLGAEGIDGGFSTFQGESEDFKTGLSFLITGDLSFIYDMNAIQNVLNKRQRVLLINNFAGGEFHTNFSINDIPDMDLYIAAGHHSRLHCSFSMLDITYLSASNQDELDQCLPVFIAESDKPIILEVFTCAETDSSVLKNFYFINTKIVFSSSLKGRLKRIIRRLAPLKQH